MTLSERIECVGGLWDGRFVEVTADEFGRLPAVLPDEGGKPFYALVYDRCIIGDGHRHEYERPRYVPAAA